MKLIRNKSERPRREHDFYPTPHGLAKAAMERLDADEDILSGDDDVLDVGAGTGVWGDVVSDITYDDSHGYEPADAIHQNTITGIDIEYSHMPYPYDAWYNEDYLSFVPPHKYDLIIGNPPYSFMEEFVRKSFEMLMSSGYVFFLGRLEFLASKKRGLGLFADFPPKRVYVLSRRPSFFSTNGHKTTDAQDYAMYLWQEGYEGKTQLDWLYWDYDERDLK